MKPSLALAEFVERWEGLRTRAYDDGGGVWTIGIGHTRGVRPGDVCTEEQARAWLEAELDDFAVGLEQYIIREPTQQQFDALLSLAYNCGLEAIGNSGLMARFNARLDRECADRFLLWNKDNGKVVPGLSKRRAAERAIYLDGDYSIGP